ncbi:MAG: acyl-CoA dehydratase activase-related protein [Halanaerobiaceae bacterium]
MDGILNVGLDIGSTTVKIIILNQKKEIVYNKYKRHFANVRATVKNMLLEAANTFGSSSLAVTISGSGGMDIADKLKISFLQEVVACSNAVEEMLPHIDVAIELGGEDAKITYFGDSVDQRMNSACAGGTGAFIDQMASLLKTDAQGLNKMAKKGQNIYPIASRCGVFAKSDVQSLLNDGVAKEDIALSILQAVVNQTIGGLAQGRPIRGNIAFLGGPLHFLSELRKRFIKTLGLEEHEIYAPDNAQYFVAVGAAMEKKEQVVFSFSQLLSELTEISSEVDEDKNEDLEALFTDEQEYKEFINRHKQYQVERADLSKYKGRAFLGIDAGSTTTKMVLIGEDGRLLYSFYNSNQGDPLDTATTALLELYSNLNEDIEISHSAVTGYGEKLLKSALSIDIGLVETVAHYTGAKFFAPDVDFILDIGGQDMKCLEIKDGAIDSVMLNEACSSGCGSFIETFAKSLQYDVEEFAEMAVKADRPLDLGTRCTVFMNSKVREAQKKGASINNISAGLAVSVIKNALFKVIGFRNNEELGKSIVVQGGTFYNDAVLRALEKISGQQVVRPDIAGLMGAFGAALYARDSILGNENAKLESTILAAEELKEFEVSTSHTRCRRCENNCMLTIKKFPGKRRFITGNRCEKGIGLEVGGKAPNLFRYKYERLFSYKALEKSEAKRGIIGIPRALNIYEDYPFWFTFFTELGYRVVLSSESNKEVFELGMETIPSELVCYPAKLVHGHIIDLLKRKGIKKIFYPSVAYSRKEDEKANNNYNCPIVASYPDTIKANMEILKEDKVIFYNPFLSLDDFKKMEKRLFEELKAEGISLSEINSAVEKAEKEYLKFKNDVRKKGEEILDYIEKNEQSGIVLAGRPYHLDPEVNHGIAELIESLGLPVLSEDSISHLEEVKRPIRVIDQWVYHTRLYRAAQYVASNDKLELVQLNSFGCGLDAVTIEQIEEILEEKGKLYTLLKIDEISNLGAARIRIRSLIAAINERKNKKRKDKEKQRDKEQRPLFTEERKKTDTILAPQMSPIHFQFLETAFKKEGYSLEVLPKADKEAIDIGLKYVNNDACYPSIIVIGQLMKALQSGEYDLNSTSVIISQTGGGCRATNYIAFLKKALRDANLLQIPVLSLNPMGMDDNPGFKISPKLIDAMLKAVIFGDLLMRLLYKTRPYEKIPGSANELYRKCVASSKDVILNGSYRDYNKMIVKIIEDFDKLEINEDIVKPKVGVVGEILVKYHPDANNRLFDFLEKEGAEVIIPDLMDFVLYSLYNLQEKHKLFTTSWKEYFSSKVGIQVIELLYRRVMKKALKKSKRFDPPESIYKIAEGAREHLVLGHHTGEGWFLTGEMVELIKSDVKNIICVQPFACLPNHVVGKGMLKELRDSYSGVNIKAIDYDSGASVVNQENRIKLLLSTAFKNLDELIAVEAENISELSAEIASLKKVNELSKK